MEGFQTEKRVQFLTEHLGVKDSFSVFGFIPMAGLKYAWGTLPVSSFHTQL